MLNRKLFIYLLSVLSIVTEFLWIKQGKNNINYSFHILCQKQTFRYIFFVVKKKMFLIFTLQFPKGNIW